jgi:hypothetical protein
VVKFRDQVARLPFHDAIPPEIRRRREELGFDYAKFDYLVTADGPKLGFLAGHQATIGSRGGTIYDFCIPAGVDVPDIAAGLVGYMRTHEQLEDNLTSVTVWFALESLFPCPPE